MDQETYTAGVGRAPHGARGLKLAQVKHRARKPAVAPPTGRVD